MNSRRTQVLHKGLVINYLYGVFKNKLNINVSNIFLTSNIKKTILMGFFRINED